MTDPSLIDTLINDLGHQAESLTGQLARVTEQLELAHKLRATFDAPVPHLAPKREQRAKPITTTATGQEVICPDCGVTMGSRAGLAIHRKRKHPSAPAPKPAAVTPAPGPVAPTPAPTPAVEGDKRYFQCLTCDAKASSREALARHTDGVHRRGLTGEEHFSKGAA